MPQGTPRRKTTRRREGPAPFPFTYRCPANLIGPVDEARFILRERSRTSLMTKALMEYLTTRGIPLEVA